MPRERSLCCGKRAALRSLELAAAWGMAASGLAILGDRQRLADWIDRALLITTDNWFMRYNFSCIVAAELKDREWALELLEPVFDVLTPSSLKATIADPDIDSLRDDPRYIAGVERAKKRLNLMA